MKFYLIYILIYLLILFTTIFLSKKLGFYDAPNYRKVHKKKTLNTSGVSLYIFLLLIVCFHEYSTRLEEIIVIGFFVVIGGFIDDRKKITPGVKLIFIFLPTSYLIMNGYKLDSLGEYEYLGLLKLGKFSFVFTILAIALLVNSFNYIDGIDGLLISVLITNLFYVFFLVHNQNVHLLISIILIPLLINLIFNFLPKTNPNKIFLGDSGSLFLGFFIGFLMIYLYKYEKIHPSYIIWLAWYPVADFLFVTLFRIFKKKNFYTPDKLHLHHKVLYLCKYSHFKTTLIITSFNLIVMISGSFITKTLGNIYSLSLFTLSIIIFFFIRFYFEHRWVEQSGSSSGS